MAQCTADVVPSPVATNGAVIITGRIYLYPQNITQSKAINAVEMFSPSPYRHGDGQWTRLSSLHTPRVLAGLVVLDSGLLAMGELSVRSFICNSFNK